MWYITVRLIQNSDHLSSERAHSFERKISFASGRIQRIVLKPEIFTESNSSRLNACHSNNANFLRPPRIPRAFVILYSNECGCRIVHQDSYSRENSWFIFLFPPRSLQTPQGCREFLFVCEIGGFPRPLRSARAWKEVLLTRTIIRLHQRFLPWRSWNFAHFGRIPPESSPSSQPQRQATTTTNVAGRSFPEFLPLHFAIS